MSAFRNFKVDHHQFTIKSLLVAKVVTGATVLFLGPLALLEIRRRV